MTGKRAALTAMLVSTSLFAQFTLAARLASAPTIDLTRGYHLVMIARATAVIDATHVLMTRSETLHGQTDDVVTLRADAATIHSIRPGATYIVGYARLMKHPQYREIRVLDPQGPRIVTLRHSGTRALFEDTRHTRRLFAAPRDVGATHDAQRLSAIVAQLERPDALTRAFVIAELRMRPELRPLVGPGEQRVFARVLDDERLDTASRDYLLQASLALSPQQQQPWLAEACRAVVDRHGVQVDLASSVPSVVRTALEGLALTGDRDDIPRVTAHLASNAPGVAKAALATLDALDSKVAAAAVAAALRNDTMHRETKRAFEAYLRERAG